jgi:hypothetical protein
VVLVDGHQLGVTPGRGERAGDQWRIGVDYRHAQLTNCHFLTNWYDGVEILGNAANIDFIGCQFSGNGFGSPGNYNGLLAYGNAGIGGLSIIGGRANGSLWQSWPTVQGSGLNIGNGISPLTIQGVQTIGNLTGGIVSDSPY